jgi:hypothetical protein
LVRSLPAVCRATVAFCTKKKPRSAELRARGVRVLRTDCLARRGPRCNTIVGSNWRRLLGPQELLIEFLCARLSIVARDRLGRFQVPWQLDCEYSLGCLCPGAPVAVGLAGSEPREVDAQQRDQRPDCPLPVFDARDFAFDAAIVRSALPLLVTNDLLDPLIVWRDLRFRMSFCATMMRNAACAMSSATRSAVMAIGWPPMARPSSMRDKLARRYTARHELPPRPTPRVCP